jgi:hypothetical protein
MMPHVWSKFTYTTKELNVSILRAEEFLVVVVVVGGGEKR